MPGRWNKARCGFPKVGGHHQRLGLSRRLLDANRKPAIAVYSSCHKRELMMSPEHRYLNFALMVSVLLLVFAANAAETAKEQLQGSIDRVIEVLRTIHSAEDIEKNRSSLRQILLTHFEFAAMAQKSLGNRWAIPVGATVGSVG
jgi:hypothetical protein